MTTERRSNQSSRTRRKGDSAGNLTSSVKAARPKVKAAAKISPKRRSRARPSSRRRLPGLVSEEANEFAEEALEILSIYGSRNLNGSKAATSCPYDAPINRFKRDAYHFIRVTLARRGGPNLIKAIVRRTDHEHKGPDFRENPFFWGLLAMDWERDVLDRRILGHFARQMQYADRHNVPPCHLVGFLYQIGKSPKALASAVADNRREPWQHEHKFLELKPEAAPARTPKRIDDRQST